MRSKVVIAVLVLLGISIVPGFVLPAGACSLLAPEVTADQTSVRPGDTLTLSVTVYEVVPASETTTTSSTSVPDAEPPLAECPPIRSVETAVVRFVQGEVAIDLETLTTPPTTSTSVTVTVPAAATAGPARIVIGSGSGDALATSGSIEVLAVPSAPAPPVVSQPAFTG